MKKLYGIIENNDDSSHKDGKKLGRCQVRVFGKHTDNRTDSNNNEYIPTSDLPWFDIILPTTSAGQQKNYDTPFMKNGSVVIVEFLDEYEQFGVITGVLLRQPKDLPDFNKGFSDPNKEYPLSDDLNKSPLYPYATGEVDQIVTDKKANVKTSTLGFTEPETKYDPTYTKNRVITTKNHFIELDDTDGKERVHIFHKSGSFKEFHPNGDTVEHVKNSKYTIVVTNNNIRVFGKVNIEANGDINIKTGANTNITTANNTTVNTDGNTTVNTDGNTRVESGGKIEIESTGDDVDITASGNINMSATLINLN